MRELNEIIKTIEGENKLSAFNDKIKEGLMAMEGLMAFYKNSPQELINEIEKVICQMKK